MTARAAILELTRRPDFCAMSLEAIGHEVGVSKQRVHQILGEEGMRKRPAKVKYGWLDALADEELVQMVTMAGSARALARQWGISGSALRKALRERGVEPNDLRITKYAHLSEEEKRRLNTQRCRLWRAKNREHLREYRRRRHLDPEVRARQRDAARRYWQSHEEARTRARCQYFRTKGAQRCPACGQPHVGDAGRYAQYLARRRKRRKEKTANVSL